MRQPRFEICRSEDGWWARFRAANGRVVWVTETYERRGGAENAISSIARAFWVEATRVYRLGSQMVVVDRHAGAPGIEIREVDE